MNRHRTDDLRGYQDVDDGLRCPGCWVQLLGSQLGAEVHCPRCRQRYPIDGVPLPYLAVDQIPAKSPDVPSQTARTAHLPHIENVSLPPTPMASTCTSTSSGVGDSRHTVTTWTTEVRPK